MTKRVFSAMWLSVMAIAVLTVSSCSNDSDIFGLDGLEDVANKYAKATFLELSDYSNLYNLSEDDLLILSEAEMRLNIKVKKGLYTLGYNNGNAVNISERLYDYISQNYNYYNSLVAKSNNIVRTKSSNPETADRNDCVPIAISHYLNIPYETVVSELANKGQIELLDAVKVFKSSASSQSSLPIGTNSGILAVYNHAVNLVSVASSYSYAYNKDVYYVYYKDWQQNSPDGTYFIVSNLDIPCLNVYGTSTIIYGFIQ